MLNELISELNQNASKEKAIHLQRFFKTGKGEYGEGDIFIGLTMPQQREIAKKYLHLSLNKIQELLKSKIHEHRMTSLIILTEKYKRSKSHEDKENIFGFYLKNTRHINNWDLVDVTCQKIVGDFLLNHGKNKNILYDLVHSKNMWERRIAMVSAGKFISAEEFEDVLTIAELLLEDKEDLMHKAVGWMLREVGKKDEKILKAFLKGNYSRLPRTTLRYAIERFEEGERKNWLVGKV